MGHIIPKMRRMARSLIGLHMIIVCTMLAPFAMSLSSSSPMTPSASSRSFVIDGHHRSVKHNNNNNNHGNAHRHSPSPATTKASFAHPAALSLRSTTFLTTSDFSRAQNMTFLASESAPSPVALPSSAPLSAAASGFSPFHYYEGDMMIQESDENKVAMYTAKRWPEGKIPYVMEDKFTDDERAAIARGIMLLQERTCIRFVPREDQDEDYVLIRRGPGCAAHVGRIGGQQWIILGDGCFGIETVTHELMHSVGFIHEQSRPDRDDHVEIVWDNIKSSAKRNFRKHEFDYLADHGFPYDLMSVMHYRQYAFSKNRKPTIVPKTPVPYLRCRGMDCPSELDIKKINFLYKCHPKDEDDYEDNYNRENDVDSDSEDVEEMLVGAKNTLGGGSRNRNRNPESSAEGGGDDGDEQNSNSQEDFEPEMTFGRRIPVPRRKAKFWFENSRKPEYSFDSFEDSEPFGGQAGRRRAPGFGAQGRGSRPAPREQFFHANELHSGPVIRGGRGGMRGKNVDLLPPVNYPHYLL